ncbi:biotin--[acetyl-CoA-carboxylase] ligase [Kamptonema cortianum]|nr:biotin--[acetyl-CoA-carboxylase] ligase [Geitlerinema splendidum]MDK3155199.1 biotin--[acetyl-CoA-carboxylase] ligase [Kamptonema cortianum]
MKRPSGEILIFDSLPSTQDKAMELLRAGECPGAVVARDQTGGRGRFNRPWLSKPGDSLTTSFVFDTYPDHHAPWLLGMATALAVAGTVHTQVQWPNDVTIQGRKVGGILTEMINVPGKGNIAVIGVGLNLNQLTMPEEIQDRATSVCIERGTTYTPDQVLADILENFSDVPEPNTWGDLESMWMLYDDTPGKEFRLPSGERGIALGIGSDGQLICSVEGEPVSVLVAEAFGLFYS